jgi:predicted transcriptional regulator
MADENNSLNSAETLQLATDIVAAYVSNNTVSPDKLAGVLQEVHDAIRALSKGGTAMAGNQEPAVPINKSVTPDYIICLEDGKKLKMLKRYLRTQYDLSPEDYRRKWGLDANYPMVAPNYARRRSDFAKKIGLGTARLASSKGTGKKRGRPARRSA